MTGGFKRARGGWVTVSFDKVEISLLDTLLGQLLDLIEEGDRGVPADQGEGDDLLRSLGIGAPTTAPSDPALARLFPDGYRDDPEAAAEFRRYTEQDLRSGKREAVRTARATLRGPGARVRLDAAQAAAWLGSLNDLRLALGTRLEVSDDPDFFDRLPAQDPRWPAFDLYLWLGRLQETLVEAVS